VLARSALSVLFVVVIAAAIALLPVSAAALAPGVGELLRAENACTSWLAYWQSVTRTPATADANGLDLNLAAIDAVLLELVHATRTTKTMKPHGTVRMSRRIRRSPAPELPALGRLKPWCHIAAVMKPSLRSPSSCAARRSERAAELRWATGRAALGPSGCPPPP
jgi:hypothetical protein